MSNQYTYNVPFTEDKLYDLYVNKGMSQDEIAKVFNTTQHVIWRAMKKMGVLTRKAAKRNQLGAFNSNWNGGRVLVANKRKGTRFSNGGYWYILNPNHKNATKSGYVAEHIMVASMSIGRPLKKGECVHHKDLNKQNNNPSNLVVCTRKQHRGFHLQLELIAVELYRQGKVRFTDDLRYALNEGGDA